MWFTGLVVYDGKPWRTDACKEFNSVGQPYWLTRGSWFRGIFVLEGPYKDPAGAFELAANEGLVMWEVKQPPIEGTQEPRIVTYGIFHINRTFVTPHSAMYRQIDPDREFQPGDPVAVWSGIVTPVEIAGCWRMPGDPLLERDTSGSYFQL